MLGTGGLWFPALPSMSLDKLNVGTYHNIESLNAKDLSSDRE